MLLRLDNQLYSAAQLQLLARRIMQDMSHLIEVCYVQQRLLRTMNSSNPIEMRVAYATLVKLTAELEASLESYSTVMEQTDPRLGVVGPKSRPLSPRLWERALDEPEALQRITGGPSSTATRRSGLWARRNRKRRSQQRYAKLVHDLQGMYQQILITAQVVQSMTNRSTYVQRMQIAGAIGRLVPLVDWLAEGLEDFRAAFGEARRSE
jgi:hypothetical protein